MGDGRMAVGGWTMMKTRRGLCAAVNLRLMIIVSGGWLGVEWWEQVRLDEEQRGNCVKLPVVLFYLVTTLATKSKHNTIHPNEERLEGSLLTGMADKMLGSKYTRRTQPVQMWRFCSIQNCNNRRWILPNLSSSPQCSCLSRFMSTSIASRHSFSKQGLAELFCLWWNGFHTCDSLKLNPIKLMYNTSKSIKAPPDCRAEKGIGDWSCESIQDWKELHGNKWPHAVCTRLTTQYQISCRNIQKDLIHFIERKSSKKTKMSLHSSLPNFTSIQPKVIL